MALIAKSSKKQLLISSPFRFVNSQVYHDWDIFCEETLDDATYTMKNKSQRRYKDVSDGLQLVSRFISQFGWAAFAVAVGVLAAGTIAAVGMSVSGISSLLALGSNPVGWAVLATGGTATFALSAATYKLYNRKELVIKVHAILEPYKKQFDGYQPVNCTKTKFRIDSMFNVCVIVVIEKMYGCEIMLHDTSLPLDPVCICGKILVPTSSAECYVNEYSFVICDICDTQVRNKQDVYHCVSTKNAYHSRGYDVCISCARKNNCNFKRYNALIIQSLPEDGQIECKDAIEMEKLFTTLNYHCVQVLKGKDATRYAIKQKLKQLSLRNNNDVNVIVYSGHGDKDRLTGEWKFALEYGLNMKSSEFIDNLIPLNDIEYGQKALAQHCTCDIVLLLNACYSGKFPKSAVQEMKEEKDENIMKKYENASRSVVVITSSGADEESNFAGGKSLFIKYVIQAFRARSQRMVTPKTVYDYLRSKKDDKGLDEVEKCLFGLQHANNTTRHGSFAMDIPLIPILKPYDH